MNLIFASKLGFKVRQTNVSAQKIDGINWETYKMVFHLFRVWQRWWKEIFEEILLLVDVKLDIVLGMPFLTISYANVQFQAQDL